MGCHRQMSKSPRVVAVALTLALILHAAAWPGQGVIAVYYWTNWTYPITANYDDGTGNGLQNLTMWRFWGPLAEFHAPQWKYVEIGSNMAAVVFYSNNGLVDDNGGSGYNLLAPGVFSIDELGNVTTLDQYYPGCPGAPPLHPYADCSSHGACDLETYECTCDSGWTNPACEGSTGCNVQLGLFAEGNVSEVLSSVFTAEECCTQCQLPPRDVQCVAANYNFESFTCSLLTSVSKVSNISREGLFHATVTLPTPTPAPAPTTAAPPSPLPHEFTESPTFYILVTVLPVAALGIGIAVIRRATASSGKRFAGEADPLLRARTNPLERQASEDAAHGLYGGKYRILKVLGRGSFGVVYLVTRNTATSSPSSAQRLGPHNGAKGEPELFAMKVIHCHSDEEMMAAFGEFRSLNELQGHSGIVALVDMFMSWEAPGAGRGSVGAIPRTASSMTMSSSQLNSPLAGDEHRGALAGGKRSPVTVPLSGPRLSAVEGSAPPMSSMRTFCSQPRFDPAPNGPLPLNGGNDTPESDREHSTRYLCLVMEYYAEGTLEHALLQDPAYFRSEAVVLSFMRQICSALAHSHAKNIIHRDLKPGNFVIGDGRRRIAVTDFGLARDVSGTSTTAAGGTLHYLAPEQLDHRCSKKSDVWSAACVIVAMVTGTVGGNVRALFMLRMQPDFEAMLRAELAMLPEALVTLLLQMLAASPIDRPSFDECLRALDAIEGGAHSGSRSSSAVVESSGGDRNSH